MAKIEVSAVYCKGCGYCVEVCPKKIIQIGNTMNLSGLRCAEQTNSEECTACKLCAVVCPESAITVYK